MPSALVQIPHDQPLTPGTRKHVLSHGDRGISIGMVSMTFAGYYRCWDGVIGFSMNLCNDPNTEEAAVNHVRCQYAKRRNMGRVAK